MSQDQIARKNALIALAVIAMDKLTVAFLIRFFSSRSPRTVVHLNIHATIFAWIIPLLIVYLIERKDRRDLGLCIGENNYLRYAFYVFIGLVLPAFFVRTDGLVINLIEQVLFIGFAEEVLWRGYLQERLCRWMGKVQGWLITSILFGAGHLVTILSHYGAEFMWSDLLIVGQTTAGGLILGFIYMRARSIIPGSVFHIFGNVYLFPLVALLTS
jgi:membrane protease YdiL (CAAX protease family)